jgi:hypothetical protein
MPRNPKRLTVEGDSYTIQYLDTSTAIEVATDVGGRLLPVIALAVGLKGGEGTQDLSKLGDSFETVAKSLPPKKMVELIRLLCSVVIVEGPDSKGLLEGPRFEEHFKGRPGLALRIAKESFEVNCPDFFDSVAGLAGLKKTAATTPDPAR